MEGILGFLFFIVVIGGIFFVYQWIMAKYFGVRYHGRFSGAQAVQKSEKEKELLKKLSIENPNLTSQAVERCKEKHYKLTPANILSEATKIVDESSNNPNLKDKLKRSMGSIVNKIKFDQTSTKIEKLEKLKDLKQQNIITEKEFIQLKNEII